MKLIIESSGGCVDSIEQTITVNPNIHIDIGNNDSTQCLNNHQFEFDNKSVVNGIGFINKYTWVFSDGTSDNSPSPKPKKFNSIGTYTVKCIMETDKGCLDTFTQNLHVRYSPELSFDAKEVCIGDSVYFDNTTPIDSIKEWDWDFGDGTNSQNVSPYNIYQSVGGYSVRLNAEAYNGCRDSLTKYFPNLVNPIPKAYFEDYIIDNTEELRVGFTNLSSNGDNYLWNFGEGTSSSSFSPDKVYNDSGTYNITLTATSKWGCTDSFSKLIIVFYSRPIYIPSAFTPNGDGLNNTFGIETLAGIKELDMKIFNRWGEQIFQSSNTSERWGGYYKGELVPDGAYLYIIRAVDFSNKLHIYNGTVTVIK